MKTLLHFLNVKAFSPVTMEALSFVLWRCLVQTQGAGRAERRGWRRGHLFSLCRPRVCPPVHLPWWKEMQSGLFYRQRMMVTPYKERPDLSMV